MEEICDFIKANEKSLTIVKGLFHIPTRN